MSEKTRERIQPDMPQEARRISASMQGQVQPAAGRTAARRAQKKPAHIPKRQTAPKRTRLRRAIWGLAALALVLLAAAIIVLCTGSRKALAALQGTWRYDAYTEYEFDGEGGGCMCIDEASHYPFEYAVKGSTVQLDFTPEYVTDCAYDFRVENDRLTLIGGEGTANPGQEYTLERVR